MASNFKISTAARNAACNAIVDLCDAGSGPATLEIRTGSPPATPATADSGTLLAVLTFSDPAFGSAATGVATAASVTGDSSANATGDAGHFRIKDSDGNVICQGTCGEAADSPDMVLDEKSIVTGEDVNVTALTITVPAS